MTQPVRVTIEVGPKGKKVIAVAQDWPGLERGAKTEELALERLQAYLPRYAPIASLAGMDGEFAANTALNIVEHYPGVGSTDFWGISFAFSSIDKQPMSSEELERELTLMRACWSFFDVVRARVSAEMQKGTRGGGKDRDEIVRHTLYAELQWAKMIGVLTPGAEMLTDEGLTAHRAAYCTAIRAYHAQGKPAGKLAKWPLRYLIRHTAYHALDHSWEMEDKNLVGA
ncbi:MAG: hypothetical protein IPO91_20225 [Chloroflexi bacterium]|nr:hypothetical protein [Chloroflexota bacterium]